MNRITNEHEAKELVRLIEEYGTREGRRIAFHGIENDLDAEEMAELVAEPIDGFREWSVSHGFDERVTTACADLLYSAIIKEGARISRQMTYSHEGGIQ